MCRTHFQESYNLMRNEDFSGSTSGHLVPTVYDQMAYMPNVLPPKIHWAEIALDLAAANQAVGELKGACRRLTNPYILIAPLRRLEAQTSSAMEDTHTTADELVVAEADISKASSSEAREVSNYIRALSWATNQLPNLPISGRLLKGAHKILLSNVGRERGEEKQPGEYARDQNMIGAQLLQDPKARLASARFIPPPPDLKADAMAALETYLNRRERQEAALLLDIALAHYQFETIHPFGDGNGRIGRMLISLMPLDAGLLEKPVLYMSPELETRKSDYIDLMYEVSAKGSWTEWLQFFLATLKQSCMRTITTIDRIIELNALYIENARSVSRSSNMLALIDLLFLLPAVQVSDVIEHVGVTDAAARNLLSQLEKIDIVAVAPAYYPKTWFARELISVARP
jgi:cell filamentation protein, protein adenylyltransferase